MTHAPAPRDRPDVEAAAERLMALQRLRQQADSHAAARGRGTSRAVVVLIAATAGAVCGAVMGAARGHAITTGFALAVVGGLFAFIGTRPR